MSTITQPVHHPPIGTDLLTPAAVPDRPTPIRPADRVRFRSGHRIASSVMAAVGGTPLIALDRMFAEHGFSVFGKVEKFNPGGSVKDRTARSLIEGALEAGELIPGVSTVIESTSGNLGIALAQACRYYDLGLIAVTDPKATEQNIALMRAYGAEVDVIDHRDPVSGEYLPVRLQRVQELLLHTPHSYWPNQYANVRNAGAHQQTMAEIVEATGGEIDYLFCTVGSCGTLRGCAEYIFDQGLDITVYAVDAATSVIFGPPPAEHAGQPRRIPGHGSAIVPPLLRDGLADRLVRVTDADCVTECRRLLDREAILAGGSSGAVLAGLRQVAADIPSDATCVALLADGGDRYLDTVYSDAWVAANCPIALPERTS